MTNFTYTITDPLGIHARPAGMLVKTAGNFASDVMIEKGNVSGNAKKIFSLMNMNIKCGDTIEIKIDGSDETAAAEAIKNFLISSL